MLQQTRVSTVVPYFNRFVKRFPDVHALAMAKLEDALLVWEGLGYYARVKHLHEAARLIAGKNGGELPKTSRDWMTLPGIGPYTAAAIASISSGERVPAVDGNVLRVMSRFRGNVAFATRSSAIRNIQEMLSPMIRSVNPSHFNQALMEIGATLCLPRKTKCHLCPLKYECISFRKNGINLCPVKREKEAVPHYQEVAGAISKNGRYLIVNKYRGNMLHGLWEFPRLRVDGNIDSRMAAKALLSYTGLHSGSINHVISFKHAYSHFCVTVNAFSCTWRRGSVKTILNRCARWAPLSEIEKIPMSTVSRRIFLTLTRHGKTTSIV